MIFLVKKAPVLSALGTVLILPPPDQTQDPADARQLESNGHNVTYILVVTNLYIEIYRLFHCPTYLYSTPYNIYMDGWMDILFINRPARAKRI